MNACFFLNSIALEKFLKRYKLTLKVNEEIIKAAQKRYLTWSSLNILAIKIAFKDSNINKNS